MILDGVRILEFGYAWAGPLVARTLGDLGAEVIKIEQDTARGGALPDDPALRAELERWQWGTLPEPLTRAGVYPDGQPGERPWNRSGIFVKMNRNKRGLCIDLKAPEGKEIFRKLVEISDVVLDNFSPKGARSLGIDFESVRQWNPRVISVSLSGYGHTGPYQQRVSYGPVLEAHSGMAYATGYAGGGPTKLGHAFPDSVGGLHGTFAVLAALWERDRTGEGCFVDVSQLETQLSIGGDLALAASVEGKAPERHGNRSPVFAPQGVYPAAAEDGPAEAWIAITIDSDEAWQRFVDLLDDERLRDPAYATVEGRRAAHDALDAAITEWTSARNRFEATALLQAHGIIAQAVHANADLVDSPQLRERGFVVKWTQPDGDEREYAGFPIHFSDLPPAEMRPAPGLGADNRYVIQELLQYSEAEYARLEEAGVITQTPPGVGVGRA